MQSEFTTHEINETYMWQIIGGTAHGTASPSETAHKLFHWLDDIVNERCGPFADDEPPKFPGDTPRLGEFSTQVALQILSYAGSRGRTGCQLDEDTVQGQLADMAREFWSLLATKKWIYRGRPMAESDDWMLENLCNVYPDREDYYSIDGPTEDEITMMREKDIHGFTHMLAMLAGRGGLHWLRRDLAGTLYALPRRAAEDLHVYRCASIIEIDGKSLYTTPVDYWVPDPLFSQDQAPSTNTHFVTVAREKGGCERKWPQWLEAITKVAEDQSRKGEVREAARKMTERMVKIEEEVKQEREAKKLEEKTKVLKEEEEKTRNEKGEMKLRACIKN